MKCSESRGKQLESSGEIITEWTEVTLCDWRWERWGCYNGTEGECVVEGMMSVKWEFKGWVVGDSHIIYFSFILQGE
jgi:hypothetical protein